ncbi:MAG TPA: hypothetical protein VK745_23645 [Polyangiaceae bacterium]|jgi:hypothetical protein|nr:hypothetical protein [Polyangiaceae bacterium]
MMSHRQRALVVTALTCAVGCGASNPSSSDNSRTSAGSNSGGAANAGGSPGAGSAGQPATSSAGALNSAGSSAAGAAGSGVLGSGGTAGAGGSAGVGGATAITPCGARPGLLFCDDFESAAVGAVPSAPWSAGLNGDGTVAVDDSVPGHSGTKSVYIHGSGFQTLLVYHDTTVLPQSSGKFYTRAFVRFGAAMTSGHNTFVIADTLAAPGGTNTTRVGEMNSMLMMTVDGDAHGYLSNQNYYNDGLPGVQFQANVYTCLELLFDAPNTTIDVWVNGTEVPDLHVTNIMLENYDTLRFGFEQYAGPVSDFWYDDIAIGTQQIGCN